CRAVVRLRGLCRAPGGVSPRPLPRGRPRARPPPPPALPDQPPHLVHPECRVLPPPAAGRRRRGDPATDDAGYASPEPRMVARPHRALAEPRAPFGTGRGSPPAGLHAARDR